MEKDEESQRKITKICLEKISQLNLRDLRRLALELGVDPQDPNLRRKKQLCQELARFLSEPARQGLDEARLLKMELEYSLLRWLEQLEREIPQGPEEMQLLRGGKWPRVGKPHPPEPDFFRHGIQDHQQNFFSVLCLWITHYPPDCASSSKVKAFSGQLKLTMGFSPDLKNLDLYAHLLDASSVPSRQVPGCPSTWSVLQADPARLLPVFHGRVPLQNKKFPLALRGLSVELLGSLARVVHELHFAELHPSPLFSAIPEPVNLLQIF